jgi:hypothetical protein
MFQPERIALLSGDTDTHYNSYAQRGKSQPGIFLFEETNATFYLELVTKEQKYKDLFIYLFWFSI